jgi:hypothetical protein
MAIIVLTYDLPATNLEAYGKWALETTRTVILKQPGIRSVQAFRNTLRNRPEVMAIYEFEGAEAALQALRSDALANVIAEAKALGVTNWTYTLWETSPLTPEPLTP